jgi:uncharacterized YkwD family protein
MKTLLPYYTPFPLKAKKIPAACVFAAAVFLVSTFPAAAASVSGGGAVRAVSSFSAIPVVQTYSNVTIDGASVQLEAYNIAFYNYFKLRPLASAIDIAVWYDEPADTVYIDTTEPYDDFYSPVDRRDANGGGGAAGGDGNSGGSGGAAGGDANRGGRGDNPNAIVAGGVYDNRNPAGDTAANGNGAPISRTMSSIRVNGAKKELEAYNIGGYNYFKLRDILSAIDVGVWYEAASDTIHIETDKGYDSDYSGSAIFQAAAPPDAIIDMNELPLGSAFGGGLPNENAGQNPNNNESPRHAASDQNGDSRAEPAAIGTGQQITAYRLRIVELVNEERAAAGRNPLFLDESLFRIAQIKSLDMAENNYFDHISPTNGGPENMYRSQGVNFLKMGENIALGYLTPETVIKGWMNSPGHKANMLDPEYTHIGVGLAYNSNGVPLWTQMFLLYMD